MQKMKNQNLECIAVPENLAPLVGYVMVYTIIPPTIFSKMWLKNLEVNRKGRDKKSYVYNLHDNHKTYISRRPLIAQNAVELNGTPVDLKANPLELPDLAFATFVVAATQKSFLRAASIPNLSRPLKPTTRP